MKKLIIVLLVIATLVAGFYIYNTTRVTFDGNRLNNPDHYSVDFTKMNKSDTVTLKVEEGQDIGVSFSIEKGKVYIEILDPNGNRVYKGDEIKEGSFIITDNITGDYTVNVTAKNAKGMIDIQVVDK